jgi:hypothetical protein
MPPNCECNWDAGMEKWVPPPDGCSDGHTGPWYA